MIGVVALVVFSFDYPLVRYVSEVERDRIITAMERDAYVLAGRTSQTALSGGAANRQTARELLAEFARVNSETAAIIDSAGYLVASTDAFAEPGSSYLNRPEVDEAIAGRFSSGVRESVTLGDPIVYVAVPIVFGERVLGAVRLTTAKTEIDEEVNEQIRKLVLAAGVSLVFAAAVAVGLSGLLVRPVKALKKSVDDIAEGNLTAQVPVGGPGEIRHLGSAFARMAERVNNMLIRQRSFAGDAAHQIRSPLTSIRLRLEQALDAADKDPVSTKRHLEAALEDADRMVDLTEALLRLARTEGAELVSEEFDLSGELEALIDQWAPLAEERRMRIRIEGVSSVPVRTSRIALREIVGNFLDNAISYSPENSVITVSTRSVPGRIEVVVGDQGPGMSEEERERAFDRFWRGTSDVRGSGLGLAIVAQLAENAGLRVSLRAGKSGGLDAVVAISTGLSSVDR